MTRPNNREKAQAAIEAVKSWREAGDLPFPNYRPKRIAEFQNRLDYPPVDSAVARHPSGARK